MDVREFYSVLGKYCSSIPEKPAEGETKCAYCRFLNFCYSPPDAVTENCDFESILSDLEALRVDRENQGVPFQNIGTSGRCL